MAPSLNQAYISALARLRDECNREIDRLQGVREDDGEKFSRALNDVVAIRCGLDRPVHG